ncbi:ankyrin repeat-containing protein [Thermoascus aurantiacus ATCC 26904]
MGNPLSVAGTVVGLILVGTKAMQSLIAFYTLYKGQYSDIARTIERLEGLQGILWSLNKALLSSSSHKFQHNKKWSSTIKNIKELIANCEEPIQELHEECQEFSKMLSLDGIKATLQAAGRRITYPFQQSTLQKLDEDIAAIHDNLSLALDVLQFKDNEETQDDIAEIKYILDLVRTSQVLSIVQDWLKAPNATVNHNAACAKRHPGTGIWLVKSPAFMTWLTEGNSFLWLNGFAGCGKSVLCSTAIQYVFQRRIYSYNTTTTGIAFFYFTFNDKSKKDVSAMLRTLLLQLSNQHQEGPKYLSCLHKLYKSGIPPTQMLIEHLQSLIQRFKHVYIMLDALDKSPQYNSRDASLHLLVTSCDKLDIRESLNPSPDQEIRIKNDGVDEDIARFISGRLDSDPKLKKWWPYCEQIQEALSTGAQGVFRWVECQFKSLQSCPRSEEHLDRFLKSLPQSLDETYERMLCTIDHNLIEDARRILTLLCFAPRPLTLQELIDGMAVELGGNARLNRKHRVQDASDIHSICPGFIEIDPIDIADTRAGVYNGDYLPGFFDEQPVRIVRIAHFSVQEYLESERIRQQRAAIFSLASVTAHLEITQVCLIYLLDPGLSNITKGNTAYKDVHKEYPLARFAAKYWYHHYRNVSGPSYEVDDLVSKLFINQQDSFLSWVRLYDVDGRFSGQFSSPLNDIPSPVYYASILGLYRVLPELLRIEQQGSTMTSALQSTSASKIIGLVNAGGRLFRSPLQAAADRGHEKVVQILLENGANDAGDALLLASRAGNEEIVQVLLDNGADVNFQSEYYGSALHQASLRGHKKVVQILLENGADVNVQYGDFGQSPLMLASENGHREVVQMLLYNGADVNLQGKYHGSALHTASYRGHIDVVQILLDNKADVNLQSRFGIRPLMVASANGHEEVVQMLLENGADVNIRSNQWFCFRNALGEASYKDYKEKVRLTQVYGDNVNLWTGGPGSALQIASAKGYKEVVELLLTNIKYGDSIGKIVQILLDRGADVNASLSAYCETALVGASSEGHQEIVQILLDHGTDVNAIGASSEGHIEIVKILLDHGADVNYPDYGFRPLQEALLRGHKEVVQMLLAHGADVNQLAYFGCYAKASSLQLAAMQGNKEVVQMLLDHGADVNPRGYFRCFARAPLVLASTYGHKERGGADATGERGRCRLLA